MSERRVCAISAMDQDRVIGYRDALPWHLSEDIKRFKELTSGHAVLMGRKTWESLPPAFKPLPSRMNIVVTHSPALLGAEAEVKVWDSAEKAVCAFRAGELETPSAFLWIIGGEQIYRATLPYWDEVFLTIIPGKHNGDAFFPEFESDFQVVSEELGKECRFLHYMRRLNN